MYAVDDPPVRRRRRGRPTPEWLTSSVCSSCKLLTMLSQTIAGIFIGTTKAVSGSVPQYNEWAG